MGRRFSVLFLWICLFFLSWGCNGGGGGSSGTSPVGTNDNTEISDNETAGDTRSDPMEIRVPSGYDGVAEVSYKYYDPNGNLFDQSYYNDYVKIFISEPFPVLDTNQFRVSVFNVSSPSPSGMAGGFSVQSFINEGIGDGQTVQWQYWDLEKTNTGFTGELLERIGNIPTAVDKSSNSMGLYTMNFLTAKVMNPGTELTCDIQGQNLHMTVEGELGAVLTGPLLFKIEIVAVLSE